MQPKEKMKLTENLEQKIKDAEKKSKELKEDLDGKMKVQVGATTAFNEAEQKLKDDEAKLKNVEEVSKVINIDAIIEEIGNLKEMVIGMYNQAKDTLEKVGGAQVNSAELKDNVAEKKKEIAEGEEVVLSPDIENDSTKAFESISKALEDAILAYNNSIIAVRSVVNLELKLTKIQELLNQITAPDEEIGRIKVFFDDIRTASKTDKNKKEKKKEKLDDNVKMVEDHFSELQKELQSLKDEAAVRAAIGV